MQSLCRIGVWLAVALGVAACRPAPRPDRETQQLLLELDGYISASNMYVARKLDQMDALGMLARSTRDPLRRYELEMNIAREFFAFSFDSTQFYLKHCQELARDVLDDQDLYNEASVLLGHLYAKAGSYLEASQLLYGGLDTATFSQPLMADYMWALYDYSKDLAGNSGMVEKLSIPPDSSFRPRLYQLLPKDSDRWRSVLRDEFMAQGRLASADSVNRLLLSTVKPEDRNFAIFAYFESEIENLKGNQTERIAWLIRSAECDIVNAVKDYASLTMVAQNILPLDVDRSFRYLRMAQEDAVLYNAKLRPWQISRFLMEVEKAYAVRQDRQNKTSVVSSILLAILVLVLSLITYFLVVRSLKLSRMQKALADSNVRLAAAHGLPAGPVGAGGDHPFPGQPLPEPAEAGQVGPAVPRTGHFRTLGEGAGGFLPQVRRDFPRSVSGLCGAVQLPAAGGRAHRPAPGKAHDGAPDLRPDPPRRGRFQEDRDDAGLLRQHHI